MYHVSDKEFFLNYQEFTTKTITPIIVDIYQQINFENKCITYTVLHYYGNAKFVINLNQLTYYS